MKSLLHKKMDLHKVLLKLRFKKIGHWRKKMDLRHYLFEMNMRATDFAEKIGVHRNTIYGIMTGKVPCSIGTALLIEKYTNNKVSRFEVPLTERSRETLLRSLTDDKNESVEEKQKGQTT